MFPISISGSLETCHLTVSDSQRVVRYLQQALESARAADVTTVADTVTFRAGLLRVAMWFGRQSLVMVDGGTIRVEPGNPGRITYTLPTLQLLGFTTVAILLMEFAMPFDFGSSWREALFAWCWVFGGNYVFAWFGWRGFIRDALALEAEDSASIPCPSCGVLFNPADYRMGVVAHCTACGARLVLPESNEESGLWPPA